MIVSKDNKINNSFRISYRFIIYQLVKVSIITNVNEICDQYQERKTRIGKTRTRTI